MDAIHPNLSDVTSLDDEPRNDETRVSCDNEARNVEVEVKVVAESTLSYETCIDSQELHTFISEKKEKAFCSQAYDQGIEMNRKSHALSPETYTIKEARQFYGASGSEGLPRTSIKDMGHHHYHAVLSIHQILLMRLV